jgi:zinc transporter ZupT
MYAGQHMHASAMTALLVCPAWLQEQHVALSVQTGQLPRSTTSGNGSSQSAAHHGDGSTAAQVVTMPLLQEAHSNGISTPSSSSSGDSSTHASGRPSSSRNSAQEQQLAVLAHSQSLTSLDSGSSMTAVAADAQVEELPLLDASSKSSSDQDQLHKVSFVKSASIAVGDTHSSRKAAASSLQQRTVEYQQQLHGVQQQQTEQQQQQQQQQQRDDEEAQRLRKHHAGMLRLGLLMTITLTIHNLPEGFAVAFSAFTNIGPIMALAIGTRMQDYGSCSSS